MKCKEAKIKISIVVLIISMPLIVKLLSFIIKLLGFTNGEILDYIGVLITGGITYFVLRKTIENNNENLNKQIEIQKEIMHKQFEFELGQKTFQKFEDEILKVITGMNFDYSFVENVKQIKDIFDLSNIQNIFNSIGTMCNYLQNRIAYVDFLKMNIDLYNCVENIENLNSYVNDLKDKIKQSSSKISLIYNKTNQLFEFVNLLYTRVINNTNLNNSPQPITDADMAYFTKKLTEIKIDIQNYYETFDGEKNKEHKDFLGKMKKFIQLINEESIKLKNNLDN